MARAIFAGPINFVDTAASYGDGESERALGLALQELEGFPSGFVLASKADRDLRTGEFSGRQIRRSVERSLRLLGLQQIQLLYLHDPEHISFEDAMADDGPVKTLLRCQQEGLIAHLGIAGGPLDLMTRFVETDIFTVALSHNRYTLLNNEASAFWDLCLSHNVAAINAAPYGSGILAKGPDVYPYYMYREASQEMLMQTRRIIAICQRYEVPLAAVALQFSLHDPRISSTVVGITRPELLSETVDLARFPISTDLWAELSTVNVRRIV
jgi:D-threo-aldose 1-dehydrogenase